MKYNHLVAGIAIGLPTMILAFVFPIQSIQGLLWGTAFLFFVVGDSVATSLIQRYENLEEAGPVTRRICGPNPSIICSFGTRVLFFAAVLLPYFVVARIGVGVQFEIIAISALMLPLIVTVAGAFAILWNSYGFYREERARH